LIVVVVIVVLILVVAGIAFIFLSGPAVQVDGINVWAPDNVCGLNANPIGYAGFNTSTGTSQSIEFGMRNFNATSCTVTSVTTNTTGFTLSDIQVPLSIPATSNATMNMTITSPSSSFSGILNLVFL
jgi:hypothetical protein